MLFVWLIVAVLAIVGLWWLFSTVLSGGNSSVMDDDDDYIDPVWMGNIVSSPPIVATVAAVAAVEEFIEEEVLPVVQPGIDYVDEEIVQPIDTAATGIINYVESLVIDQPTTVVDDVPENMPPANPGTTNGGAVYNTDPAPVPTPEPDRVTYVAPSYNQDTSAYAGNDRDDDRNTSSPSSDSGSSSNNDC